MHITSIVNKANRVMGLIKRTVGYRAVIQVNKQLYTSLVRGSLEYCSSVWGGMTVHDTVLIERVQRAATRFILHFPVLNYHERLMKLHILPLTLRRDYLDVCMFFKYSNNMVFNVSANKYVTFKKTSGINTRSENNPMKLCIPLTKTITYQKSFFNRIVFMWNAIPMEIRIIHDSKVFKQNLFNWFQYLLANNFNSDNVCTWQIVCRCTKCRLV